MTKRTFTISCQSDQEQQIMLLKSIFGILGTRAQSDNIWTYDDSPASDVIIIDHDDSKTAENKFSKALAIVGFSRDAGKLEGLTFSLQKPVRSRDVMALLDQLDARLPALLAVRNQIMAAANAAMQEPEDRLDTILSLIRNDANAIFLIRFNHQFAYINTAKKTVILENNFDYQRASASTLFTHEKVNNIPQSFNKITSIADFFYEYTLHENKAHLVSGLNDSQIFKIKQWPQFTNPNNTKALIKVSAYFSRNKANLETAASELSVTPQHLIGFLNAVHAQNLLICEAGAAPPPIASTPALEAAGLVAAPPAAPAPAQKSGLGGLFGRIRQRLGI